jgi:hypothetical protein
MPEEMVTITRIEYDELVRAAEWLGCLEYAGVDYWDGIQVAERLRKEVGLCQKKRLPLRKMSMTNL